jgi:outer membrane protein TolC
LAGLKDCNEWHQDTLSISKSDLLAKLTDKNLQIKIAQQAYQGALADYQSSNALFLPSITASHTGISTTNPLMAFGSKLNQAILTPADFNPALLNNPVRTQNFATTIEVLQPIINVDGLYGRQAAKAKTNAFLLQTQRTQEYVEFEVNKAFMQLQMAYQAVNVMQKALEVAQANGVLINNYFNQGLVQKTDVLMVDVRINELKNQLQMAKSNVQNASDYLAFLLNEDTKNKVYKPNQSLAVESLASASNVSLSDNRKDIQAMNLSVQAYKKMWQSAQMNFLPRLNAFGSYQMYDAQIFQTSAKGYLVGAQLSWNVFDGYKSIGKIKKPRPII